MTPASIEGWIGLLIQVPIVGIFVWFSLQLVSNFLGSIDKRDQAWRDFIREQREANAASVSSMAARFSDEIRALGKEIAEMRGQNK